MQKRIYLVLLILSIFCFVGCDFFDSLLDNPSENNCNQTEEISQPVTNSDSEEISQPVTNSDSQSSEDNTVQNDNEIWDYEYLINSYDLNTKCLSNKFKIESTTIEYSNTKHSFVLNCKNFDSEGNLTLTTNTTAVSVCTEGCFSDKNYEYEAEVSSLIVNYDSEGNEISRCNLYSTSINTFQNNIPTYDKSVTEQDDTQSTSETEAEYISTIDSRKLYRICTNMNSKIVMDDSENTIEDERICYYLYEDDGFLCATGTYENENFTATVTYERLPEELWIVPSLKKFFGISNDLSIKSIVSCEIISISPEEVKFVLRQTQDGKLANERFYTYKKVRI